jgi:hypothetical protein
MGGFPSTGGRIAREEPVATNPMQAQRLPANIALGTLHDANLSTSSASRYSILIGAMNRARLLRTRVSWSRR